jgi:HD-like signal output (HDOD) protein
MKGTIVTKDKRKNILFVDDEPNLLSGLRRMLASMRREWNMHFVENGMEALKYLETNSIDVIVSDMRMPGMNGAQLLYEVAERHPHVVRIVLSGQSSQEEVFRAIGPSHQYLSKPCDPENLKKIIQRAGNLRDTLFHEDIKAIISKIEKLPCLPETYSELHALIKNEDASLQQIGRVIEKDIAMTAKILQLVNSAYFGISQKIDSAAHAVSYLGLDMIRALSTSLCEEFRHHELLFFMQDLLKHSLITATVAKKIALNQKASKYIVQQSFTAGMLHDCGHLILAANFPEKYNLYLRTATEGSDSADRIEKELFGTTHDGLGAYLLGIWGLPDPIVEAVALHQEPHKCQHMEFSPLTALHIADGLDAGNFPYKKRSPKHSVNMSYIEQFGLCEKLPEFQALYEKLKNLNEGPFHES